MSSNEGTASQARIEDEFYKVMKRFNNTQWKEFARSKTKGLNLTNYQIDDIRSDYIHDVREQKYQMLSLWYRRNGKTATIENLYALVNKFFQPADDHRVSVAEPASHDVGDRNPTDCGNSVTDAMRERPSQLGANNLEPMETEEEHPVRSIDVHNARSMDHAFSSLQDRNHQTYTEAGQPPLNQSGVNSNQGSSQNFTASLEVHSDPSLPTRATSSFVMETESSKSRAGGNNRETTVPKETGTRSTRPVRTTEYKTLGNQAIPTMPAVAKRLQGLSGLGAIMNNVQINVVGENAIGVQTNYYIDGKKVVPKRPKPSISQDYADYCSAVGEINIEPADDDQYEQHLEDPNTFYKITHKPKGAVLIINNSFYGQQDERHGSDKDRVNMEKLWDALGCKVFVRTEVSADECIQAFKGFVKSPAACASNFVVVVIMSHGDQDSAGNDIFYGASQGAVKVKDVLEIFNNKNAKRLQGIPKLFFFQFCRGRNVDMGSEHMERVEEPEEFFNSLDGTIRESSGIAPTGDATDSRGIQTGKQPTMSDTMVSFATQAGFKAFRNQRDGSWYINAIINIFMRHAHEEHLTDLMTKVNNAVASKTAINTDDRSVHEGKEMSDFKSTLRKKLFLFPGFPKDVEEEFL